MLAPMQGVTNRGLRDLFARWVKPDTLFTEFMRVAPGETAKRLAASDLNEMAAEEQGVPLVVQLMRVLPLTTCVSSRKAQQRPAS